MAFYIKFQKEYDDQYALISQKEAKRTEIKPLTPFEFEGQNESERVGVKQIEMRWREMEGE